MFFFKTILYETSMYLALVESAQHQFYVVFWNVRACRFIWIFNLLRLSQ